MPPEEGGNLPDEMSPELAEALGVASPPDPDASKETPTDDKPPGDTPKEEKGDGEEKTDKETPKPDDPLAAIATKDEREIVKELMSHPGIGPVLQRWSDRTANTRVNAATRGLKESTEAETTQRLQDTKEDKFFDGLTEEELINELKDPVAKEAHNRYLRRQEEKGKPNQEETEYNVKVQSIGTMIRTYNQLVEGSGLSDEGKEKLKAEHFTHLGEGALEAWGKAIFSGLVEDAVQKRFDAEWKSVEETRLAELDGNRPDPTGGRPPGVMPDLIKTDSTVGLEQALAVEAQRKK